MGGEEISSVERVVAELRGRASGADLLVGPGQFGPALGVSRVCVLEVSGLLAPRVLWDGAIVDGELPRLREELGRVARVLPGELDTMYATAWTLAWTVGVAGFRLYCPWGLRCSVDEERLLVRGRGRGREVQRSVIGRVLGWVAEDWVLRGVSVEIEGGETIVIAERREEMAAVNPIYDGVMLLADCAWVVGLGRSLAEALGVGYWGNDSVVE